jgi:GT2 family glycosyltransferase
LLLNPDVTVPPHGLAALVRWMDEHPEIGAASPELCDASGHTQSAARRFQSVGKSLLELSRLHKVLPDRWREEVFLGPYRRGCGDHLNVDWVPGAAFCVRREAVADAGLLSDAVLMYGEDIEWCWRIRGTGRRIGVCGATTFRHTEGESARRTWSERERSVRMWQGCYEAYARMRGRGYARALMYLDRAALWLDAHLPNRTAEARRRAAERLMLHRGLSG